jgi:uncharacterized protein (DUF1499 family)
LRRLTVAEPVSRAAVWSRRLAVFALLVAGVAILLSRLRAADPPAALTVFAAALVVAGFALMLAGAAASVIWRDGLRGAGEAFVGFILAAGLTAYPAYLAALAFTLPKINDVSTDLASPPSFLHSARARAAGAGAEPPPPQDAARAAQREAYPDLQSLKLEMDALEAYRLALAVATDLGWRVIDLAPPNPAGGGSATIEAQDRSLFFGFPSDVVIRIRPGAMSTAIDLRSVSRVGLHDFGANAARIRKFVAALKDTTLER